MTIRKSFPLLLALSGLALGCQDKQVQKPNAAALTMKDTTPEKAKDAPLALTGVAPALPPSVVDAPKVEAPKVEDLAKVEAPKVEAPKVEDLAKVDSFDKDISHAPEPDFDRPVDAKDVQIDRFVLAKDVAGREPVDESDHFAPDTKKIFAFVQLANGDAPFAVTVHFEPVDGPSALYGVKLDVPTAPRWRTWAWTKLIHTPGKYRAVLRTLEGEEITSREFTIDEE